MVRYYHDLNNMINKLINDNSKTYNGKKFLANGNETLSLIDIDSQLRKTYTSSEKEVKKKNMLIEKFVDNWQLFFHGNTHITNFKFMMNLLNLKSSNFDDYENASGLQSDISKSFKEYYSEKALITNDRINSLKEEEPEDLRSPPLQNYYKVSLD